jgi:hypothetical protein
MDGKQNTDSALMATNGLLYRMPQPLSVCVNRTFKKEYAQRQQYGAGDTMVFDVNSGSSYVDPSSCMLSFKVTAAAKEDGASTDRWSFATGLATNLIKEIRILSKNGCEVDRTQNANVLAKILKDYTYSADGHRMLSNAGHDTIYAAGRAFKMVIPLSLLSGFFRPTVKGMKIPAGLCSGLRVEFILETAKRALTYADGEGTGLEYMITDPEMLFMCMDLNDPTQAVLMKNSAETGLEYTFPSYFSTPLTTTANKINEQVKKAVAQCTRAFCTVFHNASIEDETKDGFASISSADFTFKNFQFRVGSNYYPKKDVSDYVEAYYVTSACFNKSTDLQDFPHTVTMQNYAFDGKFVMGIPIETNSRLNLSGIPLNNSNVLELRAEIESNGQQLDYIIFIEHMTVARTFINSTSIKI